MGEGLEGGGKAHGHRQGGEVVQQGGEGGGDGKGGGADKGVHGGGRGLEVEGRGLKGGCQNSQGVQQVGGGQVACDVEYTEPNIVEYVGVELNSQG